MKKFLALLISAAMIFALVAIPAAADGEVQITVATVNDVEPGTDVEVPVTIEGDYEAHILTLFVNYDPENLSIEKKSDIKNGDLFPSGDDAEEAEWAVIKDIDSVPGQAKLGIICPHGDYPITGSGSICKIKFHVSENCTENQTLTLQVSEFKNMPEGSTTANPIPYVGTDGAINLHQDDPQPTEPTPTEPTPTEPTPTEPTPTEPTPTEPAPVEGNQITIGSKDNVKPGDEVTVPVEAVFNDEAHILNAVIDYDADVLTLVDAELGEFITGIEGAFTSVDTETPGKIYLGVVCAEDPMTGEGVLMNLTFKTADDFAEPTTVAMTINEFGYMPVDAANAEPLECELVDGIITPAEPVVPTPVEFVMGSKENVAPGSEITLPFTISGDYEAHLMNIALNYDTSVLTLTGFENGEVLNSVEDAIIVVDSETVPGSIRLGVVMPTDGMTAEGVIANLKFKVSDKFTEPTVIEVNVTEFGYMPVGAANAEPIPFTATNGIVTPGSVGPNPPVTGAVSLAGIGVLAIATGAGVVIFRKKED